MNTIDALDPQFRDAISNLVLDDHASTGLLTVPHEAVQTIRHGLEQALADSDSMYSYLKYLNSLNVRHPFKYRELMAEERQDVVLQEGMGCLTGHELAVLALNPLQLLDLRDELFQTNITGHWWAIFRRFNPEAVAINDAGREYEASSIVPSEGLSRHEQEQALAAAFFGEQASEQPTFAEIEPRELWTVSVPLESPAIEWLEVADSQKQHADSRKTVQIVFAWYVQRSPSELEVRLGSPLLITSRSSCSARLVDAQGHEIRTATVEAPKLRFVLTAEELSRSETLHLDYSQSGRYHLRLQVNLRE